MTDITLFDNHAIMPVMNIETAIERRGLLVSFVKEIMVQDTDYGTIPGTSKDTLLKPGAEKLTSFFGLSPRFPIEDRETDWTGEFHSGEPFFYFQYRCQLYRGDLLVGEGLGSCNSWEKKYRYRQASRICPECGKSTIIKGKEEYGGGWLCFAKKGGCGKKWEDGAEVIESQTTGMIPNEDPHDLVNTIDKMAQKRALVAATLIAVNASEFFTQDVEDMPAWTPAVVEEPKPEPGLNPNSTSPPIQTSAEPVKKQERPVEPEALKAALLIRAGELENEQMKDTIPGLVVGVMNEIFAGPNANHDRQALCLDVFGIGSTKKLKSGQILALRAWLSPQKEETTGAWLPNPDSKIEAVKYVDMLVEENRYLPPQPALNSGG